MADRTISDNELDDILTDKFNKRDKRKQEYFDSLPKWVPHRMKENALMQLNILSEQFSKDQIIKFVEDYPDLSVPGSVNEHGGLGTHGFYYMVGELFIFDCAVKAGEEDGRRMLLGEAEYYIFQKQGSGWRIGPIDEPIIVRSKKQGYEYIHFLISNKDTVFKPVELVQLINCGDEPDINVTSDELSGYKKLDPSERDTITAYREILDEIDQEEKDFGVLTQERIEERDYMHEWMDDIYSAKIKGTKYDPTSANEKARLNVRNIIKPALTEMKDSSPLNRSV